MANEHVQRSSEDHPVIADAKSRGFTLIEIAIAVFIVALVLSSILIPLGSHLEQRQIAETQKHLNEIKEALIGYAIANGRLPCPASATSAGVESPAGGGNCSNPYNGFVPAVSLGLSNISSQGYALDPWGNPIRYAVTSSNSSAFTTMNGMSSAGLSALSPDLMVCNTAKDSTASSCASGTALTTGVVAIVYSTGKNGGYGGTGIDERANPNPNSANNDRVFVYHTPTSASAENGEFDDVMTWLSPNILYYRMISAGKLP